MSDELTRAIAEATEGKGRAGTAKWPECCRDTYSLAIEEIAAALAPLIEARCVHREQQAFDRGYDKAMEGIEARMTQAVEDHFERTVVAVAWQEGYDAALGAARSYGHPDHWEDSPENPYRAEEVRRG